MKIQNVKTQQGTIPTVDGRLVPVAVVGRGSKSRRPALKVQFVIVRGVNDFVPIPGVSEFRMELN